MASRPALHALLSACDHRRAFQPLSRLAPKSPGGSRFRPLVAVADRGRCPREISRSSNAVSIILDDTWQLRADRDRRDLASEIGLPEAEKVRDFVLPPCRRERAAVDRIHGCRPCRAGPRGQGSRRCCGLKAPDDDLRTTPGQPSLSSWAASEPGSSLKTRCGAWMSKITDGQPKREASSRLAAQAASTVGTASAV